MAAPSTELLRFQLLRDKILTLPTVQPAGKDSNHTKEVRECFTFLLEADLITGKLTLYKDKTAKITIFCHSCGIESFERISNALLPDSVFAIPPENLCTHGQHSEVFDSDQDAYQKILTFYKWVLKKHCGREDVACDSEPISEAQKTDLLNYFHPIN